MGRDAAGILVVVWRGGTTDGRRARVGGAAWIAPAGPGAAAAARRGARTALRTGDVEAAQEAALVARHGRGLRSQVLLVPHGRRTSSTDARVGDVAPGTALVQAGYRNRFGRPTAAIEARYCDLGVGLLRSDRCGAWSWDSRGTSRCEREAVARCWHHRARTDGDGPR